MGTILASALIDRAAIQLHDVNNIEWARTEWLAWLNQAQRAIALAQPAANSIIASVALVAGARQTLPAAGWMVLDVFCNMGTNGTTPGKSIRITSRQQLDGFLPNWRGASANNTVKHFMTDPQDQAAFYVYPPSPGTNYVQISYAATPAAVSSESTAISISDIYEPALLDYMLYRAASKHNADGRPADMQYASACWSAFAFAVGAKAEAERGNNPNIALLPRSVEVPGAET